MVRITQVFFVLAFLWMSPFSTWAQDVIAIDDEEEETVAVKPYPDIKIWINGKEFPLTSTVHFRKNQRLNIHVKRLKPYSNIIVKVRKAGTKVQQQKFLANHEGELILEITTPKQRLQGSADVIYYSSDGKKHQRRVKMLIR